MSRKLLSKNLKCFLEQPLAENLQSIYSTRRKRKISDKIREKDRIFDTLQKNDVKITKVHDRFASVSTNIFNLQNQSKKGKIAKAEAQIVEQFLLNQFNRNRNDQSGIQNYSYKHEYKGARITDVYQPYILMSIEHIRNIIVSKRIQSFNYSEYKNQLREIKKIRLMYGNISKRELKKVTRKATQLSGTPGENLLLLLESRLDVVLERCGFFSSIKRSRQSVTHGQIKINSKIVNIPGYQVSPGDFIKVTPSKELVSDENDKSKQNEPFQRELVAFPFILDSLIKMQSIVLSAPVVKKGIFSDGEKQISKKLKKKQSLSILKDESDTLPFCFLEKDKEKQEQSTGVTKLVHYCGLTNHITQERKEKTTQSNADSYKKRINKKVQYKWINFLDDVTESRAEEESFVQAETKSEIKTRYPSWDPVESFGFLCSKEETKKQVFMHLIKTMRIVQALNLKDALLFDKRALIASFGFGRIKKWLDINVNSEYSFTFSSFTLKYKFYCFFLLMKNKIFFSANYSSILNGNYVNIATNANKIKEQSVASTSTSFNEKRETSFKNNNVVTSLSIRKSKPLHLEVSYKNLCAIFLYPPQRIYLPAIVDVDLLVKAL